MDLPDEYLSIELQRKLEIESQCSQFGERGSPADFLEILLSLGALGDFKNPDYLIRIAQVACEQYIARRSGQPAPNMIIVPFPLTKGQTDRLLGNRLNYVMVFGAESIYFQDTVHAFSIDSLHYGGVNVFGAHINWLSSDGKGVRRAILVDETGVVKEVAFEKPVFIDVVHILHLPLKQEREWHKELSAHFRNMGILQINPYEDSAERADDKFRAHSLWSQYGQDIVSPRCTLIPRPSTSEEILGRLKSFIGSDLKSGLVVQPNSGTEGHKAERFQHISAKHIVPSSPIVKYISDMILPEDDAIVREERGNIRYKGTTVEGGFDLRNIVFRINVAWNGSGFVAESGYAQVAKSAETFPASRGRGGSIIDINKALANLYYIEDGKWSRFIPSDKDISAIKESAVNAAHVLNAGLSRRDYLKFIGIDILLEMDVKMIPVVLEANSRPAGLSHSCEIIGISDKKPRSRVSTEIFKFVLQERGV